MGSNTITKSVTAILKKVYPIGSIYISTASTNPGTLFGFGTWATFGAGKTLVSLDSGDADFDVSEETGGEKTHALSTAELAEHTHIQDAHNHTRGTIYQNVTVSNPGTNMGSTTNTMRYGNDGSGYTGDSGGTANKTATNQNTGSGTAHNNLQPYIVTYMFKRTE